MGKFYNYRKGSSFLGNGRVYQRLLKTEINKYNTGQDVTEKTAVYNKGWYFWSRGSCFMGNGSVYQRVLKAEIEKYQKGCDVTNLT